MRVLGGEVLELLSACRLECLQASRKLTSQGSGIRMLVSGFRGSGAYLLAIVMHNSIQLVALETFVNPCKVLTEAHALNSAGKRNEPTASWVENSPSRMRLM